MVRWRKKARTKNMATQRALKEESQEHIPTKKTGGKGNTIYLSYMRARKTTRLKLKKIRWRVNWLRVAKMLGGSLAGIVLIGLAIVIAPANIPGVRALKQLAATTLISVTILEPTPTVTNVSPRESTVGTTLVLVGAGTNFGWDYGSIVDPWFMPFIDNVVLVRHGGTEQIIASSVSVTDTTHLTATFTIPNATIGGHWWDAKAISDEKNNILGILENAIYIIGRNEVRTAASGGGSGGGITYGLATGNHIAPTDEERYAIIVVDHASHQTLARAINASNGHRMNIIIELPAGTVPQNTKFVIAEAPPAAHLFPTLPTITLLGAIVNIEATHNGAAVTSFSNTFQVTFNMPEFVSMSTAERKNYGVFYLDERQAAWVRVATAANTQGIVAELNHLTKFAVFKVPRSLAIIPVIGQPIKFARNLTLGAKGDDVTQLQKILTNEKVYSGPITGYFGLLTRAGVKKYQEKYSITPRSGFVGPKTIAVLNAIPTTAVAPTTKDASAIQQSATTQNANAASTLEKIKELLQKLLGQ